MKGIEDVVKSWHEDSTEGLGIASAKKYRPGNLIALKANRRRTRMMIPCLKNSHSSCHSLACPCKCHTAIRKESISAAHTPHKPPTK